MSRYLFTPAPVSSGITVRVDTASGSDSPADIRTISGDQAITGSLLVAGPLAGALPRFQGPDGVTTLYLKTVNYTGAASPLVTLTSSSAVGSAFVIPASASAKYPALTRWYSALANRHFAPANAIVIGDSLTEGQGATSKANRWLSRTQGSLRALYTSNGSSGGASDCFMPSFRSVFAADSTWAASDYTSTGSVSNDSYGAFGQHTADFSNTATRTWTFTGTKAVLWYYNLVGASSFTWKIDAGSTTTVNTTAGFGLSSVQVYSGTSGTHTVTVAATAANGAAIAGLQLWDGDEAQGIRFHDWSHVSYRASQYHPTTGSDMTVIPTAYTAIAPALVVIEFGINEQGNNIAPSVLTSGVQQIITDVKAAVAAAPSFVVTVPYNPNASAPTYPWQQYVDALYAVAAVDPNNVTVLDLNQRMPGSASTSPALYTASDHLHPTNMGHSMIADIVTGFLSPA